LWFAFQQIIFDNIARPLCRFHPVWFCFQQTIFDNKPVDVSSQYLLWFAFNNDLWTIARPLCRFHPVVICFNKRSLTTRSDRIVRDVAGFDLLSTNDLWHENSA